MQEKKVIIGIQIINNNLISKYFKPMPDHLNFIKCEI